MWIAVLAVFAVARLLEFILFPQKNWKVWDGEHAEDVTFLQYVMSQQLKIDLKEYFYWSWHYLMKVMKECWSCILIVGLWEMYWRLPMDGEKDLERQLKKILFLKGAALGHQSWFQQCRTAKQVENIDMKVNYMERRSSKKENACRTRHLAQSVAAFDPLLGGVIWLERQLRTAFATVMEKVGATYGRGEAEEAVGAPDAGIMGYWRMLCTEVCLRHCRDVMCRRLQFIAESLSDAGVAIGRAAGKEQQEKVMKDAVLKEKFRAAPAATIGGAVKYFSGRTWVETEERYLKNCSLKLKFWDPVASLDEWSCCSWELDLCSSALLLETKSQIVERREEIQDVMKYAVEWAGASSAEMKAFMMENMPPLVQEFMVEVEGGSGGSSMEAVQPTSLQTLHEESTLQLRKGRKK